MCSPTLAISAVTTIGGAIMQMRGQQQQAQAQRASADYNAAVQRNNAVLANQQAQDAVERGRVDESRHRRQVQQLKGRQTAALAASGVDVNSGSALDTLGDTAVMGEIDALQIRDNASREAWRYRVEANSANNQAGLFDLQRRNVQGASVAPLIGAVGSVGDKWYQYSLNS